MLVFHSPDNTELLVQSDIIRVIRPITAPHREHVAVGTNSVLYLGVRQAGFGVVETAGQVLQMIRDCETSQRSG
jgi:hypothetical protein